MAEAVTAATASTFRGRKQMLASRLMFSSWPSKRSRPLVPILLQAFAAFGWLRFRPFLYPAANAWMAAHLIAPLINIAWRRHSMAKHPADGGSWARWREVLSAFVRGTALAGGIPYRLVLATFDADSTAAGGPRFDKTAGLLTAAVHFANVSTAPTIAMLWFKPLRFG